MTEYKTLVVPTRANPRELISPEVDRTLNFQASAGWTFINATAVDLYGSQPMLFMFFRRETTP